VPESVYNNVVKEMKEIEPSIGTFKGDGDGVNKLIVNKPCDRLYNKL
jgi:hypothetical protein